MSTRAGGSSESRHGRAPLAVHRPATEGRFAIRLFALIVSLLATAIGIALGLARVAAPARAAAGTFVVPVAFAFSTLFLILCSAWLQSAVGAVRREKQRKFRRALRWALASGTAFVGVQSYGLWCIVQALQSERNAGEAQLGAATLILGAAALHALHVSVALMMLAYVSLRGFNDRYDHEYSFGVSVCAWFWHALGVLWAFILGAYAIVALFLTIRVTAG